MAPGKPGVGSCPEAPPGPKLTDLLLDHAQRHLVESCLCSWFLRGLHSSCFSTTPCTASPPENVPVALLVAGSSMLAEVGNGGCFFLTLDEEWWGPLVLELWCDGVPWLKSESCVGLCREVRRRPPEGGLPSACMRRSSSPSRGKASVGVVPFGARSLDCTMML